MSRFVSIIGAGMDDIAGLVEDRANWGSEYRSYDPPRYHFNELRLTSAPLAPHIAAALPRAMPTASVCLEFDQELILEWARGTLGTREQYQINSLFTALSQSRAAWACACDTSNGAS